MLSENRDNFKSSFLVWISFISFSCLISVARISSSTMLNRRGESRHSFLVPDLRRKPFHSPLIMILVVGFLSVGLVALCKTPILTLLRFFS